jgi:hypothetical protein
LIDITTAAIGFTRVMTDPAANGWKGTCSFDQCQGFFKFSLGGQIYVSLDIDVGRALRLAGRCLLLFSTGFARHRIAAGALFSVVQDNSCFRVFGDGIFGTGESAVRFRAMVAKKRFEIGCHLNHANHSRAYAKTVFLFAGDFTGVATTAIFLIKF